MVPPGPVPNPEVKRCRANGSRTTGPARVGRRRDFFSIRPRQSLDSRGLFASCSVPFFSPYILLVKELSVGKKWLLYFMRLPCLRIWFRNRRRLPGACWVWRGWSCGGAEGRKPDRGGKGKQRNCPCASASLLFRKLFEEIREKIILPVFIFPDYFSENFEWGFKTAGLFLHLPVHVPMGNS